MILSIIVLLDVLAALSALFGLADFFGNAEVLSKIVLKEDEDEKSLDDKEEEVVSNGEFLRGSNSNAGFNRELAKTTNGEDRSGEIIADPFLGQSDLIYVMNATDGELLDSRGEVTILTIKGKIWTQLWSD